ncbi:hypothetical protein [Allobranchiibius sp. GilTou38]|uniref:hypothetical protein n=1 Tax=Allobranchiibius sp. GilTou38 TaxID=2815210 RepID=UPI001AA134BA|nr:hypothetical protein [Allobranchiibius sp. GilTou38]MBO1767127.1 hypothetical protein [Allobranchiibius sp. GilTou38]
MSDAPARRHGAYARRTCGRVALALAGGALTVATVAGCGSAGSGHTATHPAAPQTYGSLPSWLPPDPVRAGDVAVGTPTRPALAAQGDTVDVRPASGGTVRATVVGPAVPAEGLPYETPSTTCTFTVTLHAGALPVPVRVSDFGTSDHLGATYAVRLAGSRKPPAVLAAGRSTTFQLRTSMPTGEGVIKWAPDGRRAAVSWDFVVETD